MGSKPISHKQPTILSDVGSTNEATDAISILNVDKVNEIKIFSEDETSNSAKEQGLCPQAGYEQIRLNTVLNKELKSEWIKASYGGCIRRFYKPPKNNLEELKVIFCTRFFDLRPLLELE